MNNIYQGYRIFLGVLNGIEIIKVVILFFIGAFTLLLPDHNILFSIISVFQFLGMMSFKIYLNYLPKCLIALSCYLILLISFIQINLKNSDIKIAHNQISVYFRILLKHVLLLGFLSLISFLIQNIISLIGDSLFSLLSYTNKISSICIFGISLFICTITSQFILLGILLYSHFLYNFSKKNTNTPHSIES